MSVEHRAAPATSPLRLELQRHHGGTALHPVAGDLPAISQPAPSLRDRVLATLRASAPLSLRALRDACHSRTTTLMETLNTLTADGTIVHGENGYHLASAT